METNVSTNKMKIIGVVGFIGAGKDTAADYLVNFHEYQRESFASSLKDAVSAIFGWPRELLEGRTTESRAWREQVDHWWANRLGIPHLTPRWILQHWGTEVIRQGFHDDMWIASIENKLRNIDHDVVITDCRFRNEIQAIKNQGGKIIWVQRGPIPHWYDIAARANSGDSKALKWLQDNNIHASEYSWAGTEFDKVIVNNDSLEHLCSQLRNLVEESFASTATYSDTLPDNSLSTQS